MKRTTHGIIESRTKELVRLAREGARIDLLERELALLAIDAVLDTKKAGASKIACNCFREIDRAISGTIRKKLSENARDLINEMIVLDELGKTHGPNLPLALDLAKRILDKRNAQLFSEANRLLAAA